MRHQHIKYQFRVENRECEVLFAEQSKIEPTVITQTVKPRAIATKTFTIGHKK